MLTDEKRKKLLAGALAVVMLTGVAGCGNNKDSEWKNDNSAQNNQDEKKDEDNGGFFHGFFPWYFIGRTFGVGPMAGVRTAPAANQKQNTAPAGSANTKPAGNAANGSTVQQGTACSTLNSKLGSTGTTGKSGIGSGMSRSSGSAIS